MINDNYDGPKYGFINDGRDIVILDGDFKDTVYSYEKVNIEESISFSVNPKAFYYRNKHIILDNNNVESQIVNVFINGTAVKILKSILKMHYLASISSNDNVEIK